MDLLEAVYRWAQEDPDRPVHRWRGEILTFGQLWERSGRVAARLASMPPGPVLVFGHKRSWMLVAFLASVRAGHPYIPVDSSTPAQRLRDIVDAAAPGCIVAVDPVGEPLGVQQVSLEQLRAWAEEDVAAPDASLAVAPDEPFYIIYTSGSTGSPKGVQISRASVNRLAAWALTLLGGRADHEHVFLNQAPFSFDLSVFELAMAQASGSSLWSIDKDHIARIGTLFDEVDQAAVTTWVSTPSFADLCLADPRFERRLLPHLETFLFCGETLPNETARALLARFPGVRVVNTYGPTESTVAVTAVDCDAALLDAYPVLPVGAPKPGTSILIRDPEGRTLPEGERGEIVIVGDTVSLGYYRRPDLDDGTFGEIDGRRSYRTGDAGYLQDGQLHFLGRLDFQVKLHGYRIEIEDIEANLRKLGGIRQAVVLPVEKPSKPGTVDHLHAIVQLEGEESPLSPLRLTIELKKQLRDLIPDYMVPKLFSYVATIPLTGNGKVDRRALRGLV